MTELVDVVNFNADASCLACDRWLAALRGGEESEFCSWLRLYITANKKTVLGLTGATLADLYAHNPDALRLIRSHPAIFGVVARPFSHDVALVRSRFGFQLNLRLGMKAMEYAIGINSTAFLPPEFMLSNEQIALLEAVGTQSVFLNPARFSHEVWQRLPTIPYRVRGVDGTSLRCIPIVGEATQHYLDSLHRFDADPWNRFLAERSSNTVVTWRDGESPFLIPDGIAREQAWLDGERGMERVLPSESTLADDVAPPHEPHHLRSYPVHSFHAWMKEFRMMGYLGRLQQLETRLADFTLLEQMLWLQAINSDVLSAVEKRSPVIRLHEAASSDNELSYTIWRSERGFEGEVQLHALAASRAGDAAPAERLLAAQDAFAVKLRGRFEFLQQLLNDAG